MVEAAVSAALEAQTAKKRKRQQPCFLLRVAAWRVASAAAVAGVDSSLKTKKELLPSQEDEVEKAGDFALAACGGLATNAFLLWPARQMKARSKVEAA